MKRPRSNLPIEDIQFSESMKPKHASSTESISLTGYKWGVYLEIVRSGPCCPSSAKHLEIPLYDHDFDKLIGMLRRAKAAARKVKGA